MQPNVHGRILWEVTADVSCHTLDNSPPLLPNLLNELNLREVIIIEMALNSLTHPDMFFLVSTTTSRESITISRILWTLETYGSLVTTFLWLFLICNRFDLFEQYLERISLFAVSTTISKT